MELIRNIVHLTRVMSAECLRITADMVDDEKGYLASATW